MLTETVSPVSALQASIDQIALNAVLEGPGSVPAGLRALGETAFEAGYDDTAVLAMQLVPVAVAATEDEGKGSDLRDGLQRLSQALRKDQARSSAQNKGIEEWPEEPEPAEQRPAKTPAVEPHTAADLQSSGSSGLAQDSELVGDFITESREHLGSVEAQMLVLEQNPQAKDAIHAVFRGFHTIKGLAGFLEFTVIQQLAHEVETLLDLARNGKVPVNPSLVDVVLEASDCLKNGISTIESQAAGQTAKPFVLPADLIGRIKRVSKGEEVAASAPNRRESADAEPQAQPSAPTQPEVKTPGGSTEAAKSSGEPFTIRVDTLKLDRLMEAVGELAIAQAMLQHSLRGISTGDAALTGRLGQLARMTSDVQRTAMSIRMVPVAQLLGRANRLVRDLARKLGKNITIEISAGNTEVDKSIAEELADPLLHMVRNAVDHGIETPAERLAAGKPAQARIALAAYYKGAQIVIEISDDGRGLDRERIIAKAIERGLIAPDAQLSDSEVFALIFEPGFSTAKQVTDLSGRGVGMDVVRRNLSKLRGTIDIESAPGKGSTFYLRLPLTLAIIEGLVVVVGEHRYIIPVFAVREMVRMTPEMLSTFRGRNEMALIRQQLMPIVRLSQRLGIEGRSQNVCDGLLVITEVEGNLTAVLIDDLIGRQEVVIKSLGDSMGAVNVISGCAILGDGRVGLILDMAALCRGEA